MYFGLRQASNFKRNELIEINSLEELLDFIDNNDDILIYAYRKGREIDGKIVNYDILIYDSYIE